MTFQNEQEFFQHVREQFRKLTETASFLQEAKGHLDHPEDLIFLGGSQEANRAVDAISATVKNPKTVTIKWDGYPALLFGTGLDKKFTVLDKHMMNKVDGSGRRIYSPEQFAQYDQGRGVERPELSQIINKIWPGLQKAYSGTGWYWGDLLFTQPLKPERDGLYHFRANPKGIQYTVDPSSEIGELLKGKQAGIVVHGYLDPDAPEKAEQMSTPSRKVYPTDLKKPLNGSIGSLKNDSDVAIVPAKMPITPSLKLNTNLAQAAKQAISKYGPAVDQLMSTAPQSAQAFQTHFTTYINSRVKEKNLNDLTKSFYEYFNNRPMTEVMREKLTKHFQENQEGIYGAFAIWTAIYNLKMDIVKQLNKAAESAPVQGYLNDGTRSQEGFVSQDLKFVDRMGFSAQNLADR